jgi:hypothetical protein
LANRIGTLNEKPLHASLKDWYARKGDRFEVRVDGYFVDIVRGKLLIEIQTGTFAAIRRKLEKLLENHRVRLVYPIAGEKYIRKLPRNRRSKETRRKSPKRGSIEDVFEQLVSIPKLLANPRFSLEVVLTQMEEVRRYDRRLAWYRRGWVIEERRLLDVLDRRLFKRPKDMACFVPEDVPEEFRTRELADAMGRSLWSAQQVAYCLREMGAIEQIGKSGNWNLYKRQNEERKKQNEKRKT